MIDHKIIIGKLIEDLLKNFLNAILFAEFGALVRDQNVGECVK